MNRKSPNYGNYQICVYETQEQAKDNVTHVVIPKDDPDYKTLYMALGTANKKPVVTQDWVTTSLANRTMVPEGSYMTAGSKRAYEANPTILNGHEIYIDPAYGPRHTHSFQRLVQKLGGTVTGDPAVATDWVCRSWAGWAALQSPQFPDWQTATPVTEKWLLTTTIDYQEYRKEDYQLLP